MYVFRIRRNICTMIQHWMLNVEYNNKNVYEHCSCQIHIPIYRGSSNLGITDYSLLYSTEYTKLESNSPNENY